jgi:hypothetical protein
MTPLVKFRYAGLWASEYPLVVHRLVESHKLEMLQLQRSFVRLDAFRPHSACNTVSRSLAMPLASIRQFAVAAFSQQNNQYQI